MYFLFGVLLDFLGFLGYLIFAIISYVTLITSWDNAAKMKLFPLITVRFTALSIILVYIGTLAPSKIHLSYSSIVIFVENPTTSTLAVSRFYQSLFIGCFFTLVRVHFLDTAYHSRYIASRDQLRSIINIKYRFVYCFWVQVILGILATFLCLFLLTAQVPINQVDEIRDIYGIELNQTAYLSFAVFTCSSLDFFPLLSSSCSINWASLVFLAIVDIFLGLQLYVTRIVMKNFTYYYNRNVHNYPIVHQHFWTHCKTTMNFQFKLVLALFYFPIMYLSICLFFNIHQNLPITFLIYIFIFYPALFNLIGLACQAHNKIYILRQLKSFRSELKCFYYLIVDTLSPPPELPETGVFQPGNIQYLYDSD